MWGKYYIEDIEFFFVYYLIYFIGIIVIGSNII